MAMLADLETAAYVSPFVPPFVYGMKGFSVAKQPAESAPAPKTCPACEEPLDSHKCATCGGCWVNCGCPIGNGEY